MPEHYEQDRQAVVFVSNCSHDPTELARTLIARIEQPPVAALVEDFCRRTIERYLAGECIQTMPELDEALTEAERAHNIRAGTPEQRDTLLQALWHPFNDTLYRQQALRWIGNAVDKMGLTLSLYGNGWEKNAEFSRFARGYAGYGGELESLTRRNAINLHIVPFGCLHQRLFDGLVCGGFFMIRDHPVNHFAAELHAFIEAHVPSPIGSLEEARAALQPDRLAELDQFMTRYRRLISGGDPIKSLRNVVHRGLTQKLPALEEVSFANHEELAAKLKRFISDPNLRNEIAGKQRAFVESYFTYESNMRRIVGAIRNLLIDEPQTISQAA
jgi:hypothetical protein